MQIEGSVVLLTGANGGIGRAFVHELLKRGATKVSHDSPYFYIALNVSVKTGC